MRVQPTSPVSARQRLIDYAQLLRLDRPVGWMLLLWPTLGALWIASGCTPEPGLVLIFTLGTIVTRSAGCAVNDWADRGFDAQVERTRGRPLARQALQPWEALALFAGLMLLALGLVAFLNRLTMLLAIPGALLAASYPFFKRFTQLPQAYLGIAFSWGIPMAFAAVRNAVPWDLTLLLMAANLCWVVAYDTLYAMVDRDDDLRIGVRSTAILFGRHDLLIVGLLHAAALLLWLVVGFQQHLTWPFFAGLGLAAVNAVYQQKVARTRSRSGCFQAFRMNNAFGALVFAGLALAML